MTLSLHRRISIYTFIISAILFLFASCKSDRQDNDFDFSEEMEIDSFLLLLNEDQKQNEANVDELLSKRNVSELNAYELVIQNLLKNCAEGNYEAASKVLSYIGEDEKRLYRDHFNYANASEKSIVKITCDVITKWLKESADYEFISFETSPSEIGTINSVEIMFKKQNIGINRKFFRLVESKKGPIVVSID
jgi:hypothetical protein